MSEEIERATKQLALLMQARDARQWGLVVDGVVHPTWGEASLIGQEEYLRDAAFLVGAFQVIGWSPIGERDRARATAARLEAELERAERWIAAAPHRAECLTSNEAVVGVQFCTCGKAALVSEEPAPEVAEMCVVCRATGPVNFECPHPDAHLPVANSSHDANGETWEEDEEPAPEPPKVTWDVLGGNGLRRIYTGVESETRAHELGRAFDIKCWDQDVPVPHYRVVRVQS